MVGPERGAVSFPHRAGTRARRLSAGAAGSTRRCWCGRRIRRCWTTSSGREFGGAGLAAQAIELGLVDEVPMFRNPVVASGGTPFLPPVTDDIALELIETRTFGSRVICERYRRASR